MSINRAFKVLVADARPGIGGCNWGEYSLLRFIGDRINAHGDDPVCWHSHETISKEFGCHPKTVGKLLRSLETQGYIEIEHRFGRSNIYRLLDRDGRLDTLVSHSFDSVPDVAFGPFASESSSVALM